MLIHVQDYIGIHIDSFSKGLQDGYLEQRVCDIVQDTWMLTRYYWLP